MFRIRVVMVALAAFAGLFPAAIMPAAAADPADPLSEPDKKCLACHARAGLAKTLADGEALSLQVHGAAFAKSVHAPLGCATCHSDVDLAKHPGAGRKSKARANMPSR